MNKFEETAKGRQIVAAQAWLSDIPVEAVRTDAIQSFVKQETIYVELKIADGTEGLGYSYTIGTGGRSVLEMLRGNLLDALIGEDVGQPEAIWSKLFNSTRSTTVGVITALAFAAIDTAVWDARCRWMDLPLWIAAGGAQPKIPLYDTEGGWIHLGVDELVENSLAAKARGMKGTKLKVGKKHPVEDYERLLAVRTAVGGEMDIMVDANQSMTTAEAIRRAALFEEVDIYWFEEPIIADDISGHARLAASTSVPIAVGESMYSITQFREYLRCGAAGIIQADVARVGGITPWLKIAHLAEAFNVDVAPHFLMELHLPLTCAVPNATYLEHIPQLSAVVNSGITIDDGFALAPNTPGLGIDWNRDAIDDLRVA